MTNLHNNKQPNFVSFLRDNQPIPPHPHPDLEQKIMDSLESQTNQRQNNNHNTKIIKHSPHFTIERSSRFASARSRSARLLATGFLFTSVSFTLKTPRVAVEPQELENFVVKNWQNTIETQNYTIADETEAYWVFPHVDEPKPALSVSTP